MRLASVCLALLLLAAVPAAAEPAAVATDPPAFAPDRAAPGSCALGLPWVFTAGIGGITAQADCTTYCDDLIMYCSGAAQCTAVNQNCSIGVRGYLDCDGMVTPCPVCQCASCGACGSTRWYQTQNCCSGNLYLWKHQECTSSGWVDTGLTDCLVACDGSGQI